jgi:two-component system, chemotaxis family, response regulator Rcp1
MGEIELKKREILLLVEDNDDDIQILKEVCSGLKYLRILEVAHDGAEALSKLQQMLAHGKPSPDLVILDINMPRKNGFEVLEEMKKNQKMKRIPVIMLTSSNRQEDVDRAYELGAAGYFLKPMTLESYRELGRVLDHYWGRQACVPTN